MAQSLRLALFGTAPSPSCVRKYVRMLTRSCSLIYKICGREYPGFEYKPYTLCTPSERNRGWRFCNRRHFKYVPSLPAPRFLLLFLALL